jgi:diacylglycerol kinase (ATP)
VLAPVLAALRQGGFAVEPVPTRAPGDATALARGLAAAAAVEAVFALGGDGTAREVAAGLLGSRVALGLLPGGTVNLLALALGLPRRPVAAAAALCRLPPRPLDVGLAGASPFLMMVSAGFDVAVLAAVDPEWKARLGQSAILWQGLREWWRYRYPPLALVVDGEPLTASFAAVANIPQYGGGRFRLAPDARPDDGRLDLVAFRGSGRAATLGFALDLLRGAHTRRADVVVRQAREVLLTAPVDAAAQIDGDLCAERLPLAVRLAPERLFVLAPAT